MKAFSKDIVRTIRGSMKRFVSLVIITALGTTMLTGLSVACIDLRQSADALYRRQNLYDISVQSTLGLTQDDVTELADVDGVSRAEGGYEESAYTHVDGTRSSVTVKALLESGMNEPYVTDGRLPQNNDEIAVTDYYLSMSGKQIGDTVTFESEDAAAQAEGEKSASTGGDSASDSPDDTSASSDSAPLFAEKDYTIVGSAIDPTNITQPDGPVAFRASTSSDYTFFVSVEAVAESDTFTVVYLSVSGTDGLSAYSDEYEARIDEVQARVEDLAPQRERARTEEIKSEALATIADEEADALDQLADAEQELDDAQQTLNESLQEALDGQRELNDQEANAQAQLADAQETINTSRQQVADGMAEITRQEQTLEDGQAQLDAGRTQFAKETASAQQALDDGYAQLPDIDGIEAGIAQIDAQASQVNDALGASAQEAWSTLAQTTDEQASQQAQSAYLATARQAADELIAQIDAGLGAIDEQVPHLDETLETVSGALDGLNARLSEVNAGIHQLTQQIDELTYAVAELDASCAETQAALDALDPSQDDYDKQRAELLAQLEEIQAQRAEKQASLDALAAQRDELTQANEQLCTHIAQLDAQKQQLEAVQAQRDELIAQKQQIAQMTEGDDSAIAQLATAMGQATVGLAQAQAGKAQLDAGQAELNAQKQAYAAYFDQQQATIDSGRAQIASARDQLTSAAKQLEAGQAELDAQRADALQQIADARKQLEDGLAQIADGQAELDQGRADFEAERADALQQIADARAEVDDMEGATWYVQDRSALGSFSSVDSDASSIEAIAAIIPVIFFVVAVLVSLTTATRMVEEERGLIGLYKALGYSKGRILSKYLIYTLAAALIGGVLGDLVGFIVLPYILLYIFKAMYLLPLFSLQFSALYAFGSIALFVLGIVGATFITCRADLAQTPAALMRPKAPRAGSRILLERIGPLWKRMSFLNKVTARNLFRYKKRFFMTVFGIMGCTALLICGFAIKNTVESLAPRQYEQIYSYDLLAVASADNYDACLERLESAPEVSGLEPIGVDTVTVEYGGSKESMQLYVIPTGLSLDGYVTLTTMDGQPIDLAQEGVVITNNAATVLDFSAGATVSLTDSALAKADVTVNAITLNYLGNAVYMTEDAYEELFGPLKLNGFFAHLEGDEDVQTAFADTLEAEDQFLSLSSVAKMRDQFEQSFTLINMVVYVVIALAAGLAFVVLFTLSTVNIAEREREIATIKVLGFRKGEVRTYVNKETLVLTGIGILVGLPAGWALSKSFTYILKMPSIFFDVVADPWVYAVSAAFAVVFALAVSLITNRMLDRIIMVEALKSPE